MSLTSKPSRFRAPVARTPAKAIDRNGGAAKAGLIEGVAVVTHGEAEGHDLWLDGHFLGQVANAMNANPHGLKARFTHPNLSSDGLGSMIGRFHNGHVDGDVVRGDLHFSATSHDTPDGDLGSYVLDLAEEDDAAFGTSIVFHRDLKAEESFREANKERSPDPDNGKNLTHARLDRLHAADVVDEPAANPNGLFHRGGDRFAVEATQMLDYALGIADQAPKLVHLSIDPDRAKQFIGRYLTNHGLRIESEDIMADPKKAEQVPAPVAPAPVIDEAKLKSDAMAEQRKADNERLARLQTEFAGRPEFVLAQFCKGNDVQAAKAEFAEVLGAENKAKDARIAELEAKLKTSDGHDGPIAHNPPKPADKSDDGLSVEERCKKEWSEQPGVRAEFTSIDTFTAFTKANEQGRVKLKN